MVNRKTNILVKYHEHSVFLTNVKTNTVALRQAISSYDDHGARRASHTVSDVLGKRLQRPTSIVLSFNSLFNSETPPYPSTISVMKSRKTLQVLVEMKQQQMYRFS